MSLDYNTGKGFLMDKNGKILQAQPEQRDQHQRDCCE